MAISALLLLADDLLMTSRVREGAKAAGYALVTAALETELLQKASAEPRPVAVLVALNCRRADAYAVIRQLKSNADTASLPILAFAGHVEREKHAMARDAGADLVVANSSISMHLAPLLSRLLAGERGVAAEDAEESGS